MSTLAITGALGFGRFAYALILPTMQRGLGLNYSEMGLIASGNFVGYLVSALVCGLLATRYGSRLIGSLGLLISGSAMILTGLAGGFEAAVGLRLLTGVGSAGTNVAALGMVPNWFARRRRGLVSGFIVAGSGIGLLVAGQVVPRVIAAGGADGWRQSWFVLGTATLALAVAAGLVLRNRPADKSLRPLWAEDEAGATSDLRQEQELDGNGGVWRTPAIWHLSLVYVAFGFAYIIYATFFAAHLLNFGLDQVEAGDLWGLVGLLSLGSAVLWGSVSDRLGRKWALAIVFALQATALLLFAVGTDRSAFLASTLLYGLAGWSVPAIVAASVGRLRRGASGAERSRAADADHGHRPGPGAGEWPAPWPTRWARSRRRSGSRPRSRFSAWSARSRCADRDSRSRKVEVDRGWSYRDVGGRRADLL